MQFTFNHSINDILPLLTDTGQYISAILPAEYFSDALLHKCNFVIIELCTNAIKHSGLNNTVFDIYINNNSLIIKTLGKGVPFYAINKQHERLLIPHAVQSTEILTEDDINRLCVQRISDNSVRFFVEDIDTLNPIETQALGEHFGLIIICRSSDSFIYTRQADDVNIFTASFNIN